MIVSKLDRRRVIGAGYWRRNRLIEGRGIAKSLNFHLQVGAVSRRAEDAGIKIDHIDLVRRGEEALR